MLDAINRQFRLASRPVGRVKPSDFELRQERAPTPGPGEALVRILYLSLDPTNRVWMSDVPQYMPPVAIGDVMRGGAVGQVVASNRDDFEVGDLVSGLLGWQDYYLITAGPAPFKLPKLPVSPSLFLGVLGLTGVTAWFGLHDVGKPQPGQTVVVTAAAGAVGSIAGQLAKIHGCRVVGIAGSAAKCSWLRELGFDAAVNYKDAHWIDQLSAACPNGIDVDFENVGGEILDEIIKRCNLHARISLCGLIAHYNADNPLPGPYQFPQVLMKRLHLTGFIVSDFLPRWGEAVQKLATLLLEGRLQQRETVVDGLEQAPTAINKLFDGDNFGKLVIKVAEPPLG
jgi:NADPH-dependent curcumin reductase CurA